MHLASLGSLEYLIMADFAVSLINSPPTERYETPVDALDLGGKP